MDIQITTPHAKHFSLWWETEN